MYEAISFCPLEKEDIPFSIKNSRIVPNTMFGELDSLKSYNEILEKLVKVTEQDKEHVKMSYSVNVNGINTEISPFNMPFGNSSVFPIVVALMTAPKDSLVVIENPDKFHGASPFDIETGKSLKKKSREVEVIDDKIREFLKDENITWKVQELDIDNFGATTYKGGTNEW